MLVVVGLIAVLLYYMFFSSGPQVSKAENILAQADIAVKGVGKESFTFEGAIETQTESKYIGLPISGEGRIDTKSQRMYFKINFENPRTETGPAGNGSMTLETYAVNDDVYINMGGMWGKYANPGRLWGDMQFSRKLVEFAKGFGATVGPKESINGKEAYKIVVSPTLQELVTIMSSMDPGLTSSLKNTDLSNIDKGVKSIKMTIWIGTVDYLPAKVEMSLVAETNVVSPSGVGAAKSEVTMSLTASFDYKTPFNIVLPPAAQNAEEILPAIA